MTVHATRDGEVTISLEHAKWGMRYATVETLGKLLAGGAYAVRAMRAAHATWQSAALTR